MIKEFFMKKLLERQLKNVPPEYRDKLIGVISKNPEFFKQLNEEIEKKVKGGESQMKASLEVMRKHQAELQKMMLE